MMLSAQAARVKAICTQRPCSTTYAQCERRCSVVFVQSQLSPCTDTRADALGLGNWEMSSESGSESETDLAGAAKTIAAAAPAPGRPASPEFDSDIDMLAAAAVLHKPQQQRLQPQQ